MSTGKICCLVLLTLGVLAAVVALVVILTQPKCGPQRYLHGAVAADTETCSVIGRYVLGPLGSSGYVSPMSWTWTDILTMGVSWVSAPSPLLGLSSNAAPQVLSSGAAQRADGALPLQLMLIFIVTLSYVTKICISANFWPFGRYKYL